MIKDDPSRNIAIVSVATEYQQRKGFIRPIQVQAEHQHQHNITDYEQIRKNKTGTENRTPKFSG